VVFDPAVNAVQGDRGRWAKTPTGKPWKNTLWFRDQANLRISGGTNIWGPWNGKHQVWQAQIPAKGSLVVDVRPGSATEAELAQAKQFLHAPPPAPPTDPTGPMWDVAKLSQPPRSWPAEGFSGQDVKAVFYQGLPYQGRETRVFAWIGLPEVPAGTKVPGMVLIHGGGGTAFDAWVRRWTARGYAAIAMDTCGCVPKGSYGHWESHEAGGPAGWGGWDQIDEPREDQWTYHAVADAVLAHSLLRSLPEVDAGRIGLTGISWGGYLTCLVAGVDPRFRFAVPVYGCGFTDEHSFAGSVQGLGAEGSARWMRWWDPSSYLANAALPLCWVTGSNDFAYTFNALQKSYRLPRGPRTLCIRLRMPHGHGDAGEGPREIFTFADSVLKNGAPLPRLTGQGRDGNQVWATFQSASKIAKAELNVTRDAGKWPARKWEALPAQVEASGRVTATLPAGTTVYYLNLFDDRDCVVSTEHEELVSTAPGTATP
jgi:dienelactone hydrolase